MSENPIKQILSDLLPYFEGLEAQSSAILQLLKDKQIVADEELTRYLEQAGEASSVKWRAARVRMEHLFALSSHPKSEPTLGAVERKEVKSTSNQSKIQSEGVETGKAPATAPEVRNKPSSQEETKDSKKASDASSSENSASAGDNSDAAERPNKIVGEKEEPTENKAKDAA